MHSRFPCERRNTQRRIRINPVHHLGDVVLLERKVDYLVAFLLDYWTCEKSEGFLLREKPSVNSEMSDLEGFMDIELNRRRGRAADRRSVVYGCVSLERPPIFQIH